MALADVIRDSTPRQKLASGAAAAVIAGAAATLVPIEGLVPHWYPDPVYGRAMPTACLGHVAKKGEAVDWDKRFTVAECLVIANADLSVEYRGLLPCIGDVPMPDHELRAYLVIAHNIGPAKFCSYSFKTKLAKGDHAGSCALISQLRFVDGKDCALPANVHLCGGIIEARKIERDLCEGP